MSGSSLPTFAIALAAIRERDSEFDNVFVYGKEPTRVCCRPSCSVRQVKHDHIVLFPDVEAALSAGYRVCRRCGARQQALHPAVKKIQIHLRSEATRSVSLRELAELTGMSETHVQRLFTRLVGCSPRKWHQAWRERVLRESLRGGEGVAEAGYGAGYGSGSRVYEHAGSRLGMTPGTYARGGIGEEISWAVTKTAVGLALVAATDKGICWVALDDQQSALEAALRREFPKARLTPMPESSRPIFEVWMDIVITAAKGLPCCQANLDIRGTPFQLRVWELLRTIPKGERWSYQQLADTLGAPKSVRAVAGACAKNPIALLIPCHRVVRGDGTLAGYRWGIERKASLLTAERA